MSVRAVTFDFWNTLVVEHAAGRDVRLDAWLGVLEDAGFATERELLDAAFAKSWSSFLEAWSDNRQYTAADAAVEILEDLGYHVPPDVHDQLLDTFHASSARTELRLTDNVADCLRTLKAAGVRLGIICDVGMTPSTALRHVLQRHGVLELFDHWSFSDDVGVYKPDPAIFHHALDGLGVAAGEAAHIGDLRRTDVVGALGMGMTALRYRGVFDDVDFDGPDAHHVIDDHAALPEVLGIG